MLWGDDLKNGLSSEDNKLHNQVNRNEPFTLQHVLAAVKFFHFNSPCSLFHVCDVVSSYISQNSFREIASSYGILLHYITTSQKNPVCSMWQHYKTWAFAAVHSGLSRLLWFSKKKKPQAVQREQCLNAVLVLQIFILKFTEHWSVMNAKPADTSPLLD